MGMREFRPPSRPSGYREFKLIVIATEDTKAAPKYFRDMASPAYYYNPRVHIEILYRSSTSSAPEDVLKQLDQFRAQFKLTTDDELWMVIDVDDWGESKLSEIARLCQQKPGYYLAVSNPSFELWLLLHIKSLQDYSDQELGEFAENKKVSSTRNRLEVELVSLLGEYNKSKLNSDQYLPTVQFAVEQAKSLDIDPNHRWPNSLGSRIYRLAEKIMQK